MTGLALALGWPVTASAQTQEPPGLPQTQPELPQNLMQQNRPQGPAAAFNWPEVDEDLPYLSPQDPAFRLRDIELTDTAPADTPLLAPGQLAKIYEEYKGKTITVSTLFTIRNRLAAEYRKHGYFLTRVILRPQTLSPGEDGETVYMDVVQGVITDIELAGDAGPVGGRILAMAGRLKDRTGVRMQDVERLLLLIQDLPGIAVRARFSAAPDSRRNGQVRLTLEVARTAYSGIANIDNRGSSFVGPWQIGAGLSLNAMTSLGERVEAYLFSAGGQEQLYGQLAVTLPVGLDGTLLRVHGGYGPSRPGGTLGQAGFESTVLVAGATLSHPVIRSRRTNLTLAAGVTVNNADIDLNPPDATSQRLSESHLRVLRLSADLSYLDGWRGATQLSAAFDRGLHIFGATPRNAALTARPQSTPEMDKLSARITRRQALESWGTVDLDLVASLVGQYAFDVLPPSQKAQLGGMEIGRGYYYGQLTGDHMAGGSLELVATRSLDWSLAGSSTGLYGFYDYGTVWNIADSDPPRRHLHSLGGGMRLRLGRFAELETEYARRLSRNPTAAIGERLGKDKVSIKLTGKF
ncbi:ShlB/FhaC/HecB family hemolysin secretion/activation protein [Niveispirillum fermenti]|uniref:ShlB/FhaC/HecB family hemolysin secretion/activation protein n=1 Tax=Niveispirillum fermenti TaxID=1233113 RepID=UPI003A8A9E84